MPTSATTLDRQQLLAALFVFVGAILHSSKAIFIKLAYQYGVDSVSLVALRMAFSLPFFLVAAYWSKRKDGAERIRLGRRLWSVLIGLGLTGYYLASLLDFWGLQYLPAGLARLILFVYPTLVLLLSAWWLRRPITRLEAGAVLLTYVGIVLAFATAVDVEWSPSFWWGVVLSFGSALAYAVYLIGSGQYLPKLGTLRFTSFVMTVACVAILLHHGLQYRWALFHFPGPVYRLSLGMALFATVIPSFMVGEGIRRIGAGQSAIISSFGPISTILLAYVFLDEVFGMLQWLGALLVIGGVLIISLRKAGK
ncbi:MAG: DMT family transporter [Lewinella sp.]|nr:DMT family transporter [Lewinella sp.]